MRHPFARWPERRRGTLLTASGVAAAVAYAVLLAANSPLTTDEAPYGMVSLQVAGTGERATAIVRSWDQRGAMAEAGFSSGLDFLFMPLYAIAGALACLAVARRGWLPAVGAAMAWAAIVAAGFDAFETAGQSLFVLGFDGGDLLAGLVRVAAVAKFSLLAAALVYVLTGLPRALLRT